MLSSPLALASNITFQSLSKWKILYAIHMSNAKTFQEDDHYLYCSKIVSQFSRIGKSMDLAIAVLQEI